MGLKRRLQGKLAISVCWLWSKPIYSFLGNLSYQEWLISVIFIRDSLWIELTMEFQDLYDLAKSKLESITEVEKSDFRLEQAVFDEVKEVWEVVISYLVENNRADNPINAIKGLPPFERVYKKVIIDSQENVKGFYMFKEWPSIDSNRL